MSVGYGQSKVDVDNKAGEVCQGVKIALTNLANFAAFIASKQTADLVALGYTSDEAGLLKTNFNVLNSFVNAFDGSQAIPSPVDVRPFMAPFTGVN